MDLKQVKELSEWIADMFNSGMSDAEVTLQLTNSDTLTNLGRMIKMEDLVEIIRYVAAEPEPFEPYSPKLPMTPETRPNLVTEFHYDDGDIGAHSSDINGHEQALWSEFAASNSDLHKPSHITIRPAGFNRD